MIAFLIVVGFLASATAAYLVGVSRAGARRKELKVLRTHNGASNRALMRIEEETDKHRDIDSVLAPEIRKIIRKLREERNEIEK